MNQNRFWELLAKKQSGEATPEEQTELNDYVINNNIDKNLLNAIDTFWYMPVVYSNVPTENEIHLKWDKLKQSIAPESEEAIIAEINPNKGKLLFYRLSFAASIIAVLFFSITWWSSSKEPVKEKPNQNIVSTKNGSKSKVQLPDGTVVWLNAGSKILYNENYNKTERNVELTGEAFFDVVHNADKPFIIHTKAMNVKVLGTVFNVRAYPTDKFTEASLIKGSIEVSFPGNNAKKIILKPNEKITVQNNEQVKRGYSDDGLPDSQSIDENAENTATPEMEVSALTHQAVDNAVVETAWVLQNKMIFRSRPFQELATDMERWFNVTIQFTDKHLMDVKFTGTFSTETVAEALEALQLSYHFKYRLDKNTNTIILYTK